MRTLKVELSLSPESVRMPIALSDNSLGDMFIGQEKFLLD